MLHAEIEDRSDNLNKYSLFKQTELYLFVITKKS